MDKCLIIAEAGVNHNGSLKTALELCDAAKASGADVIKFQTWDTDKSITRNVEQADYQTANTGIKETQYDMAKKLELSHDDFSAIKKYCDQIGIVFASTPDEEYSLDFLLSIGLPFIKVSSADIGNIPFLRYIGSKAVPVILSTGMSSLADVDLSIATLYEGGTRDITLLHCTTNYPCPFTEVNLRAMGTLHEAFKLPVGYSDHTLGTEVAVAAVAMGARIIEKHITLDRNMAGPDHAASTEPDEFADMVRQIRNIEMALGDGKKRITTSEKEIKKVVTRRIVAKTSISYGDCFSKENVCVKKSGEGEPAIMWDRVIGRIAVKDYCLDDGIVL